MRLLVSVVDAGEAREAAAAGADIVDVKNPGEGSLGAPSPAVIEAVRAAVPAGLPVSAAIGDMPNLPGTAALAAVGAARSGAAFVKVGLWGVSSEALASLVADAQAAGLQVAVAGALRANDLPVVRDAGADIAGVRSAACGDGRRSGPLEPARVRALRAACAATPRASP